MGYFPTVEATVSLTVSPTTTAEYFKNCHLSKVTFSNAMLLLSCTTPNTCFPFAVVGDWVWWYMFFQCIILNGQ